LWKIFWVFELAKPLVLIGFSENLNGFETFGSERSLNALLFLPRNCYFCSPSGTDKAVLSYAATGL
jgi:hypothetical protein